MGDEAIAEVSAATGAGQIHSGVLDPMPRGYRRYILAALGFLIAALYQPSCEAQNAEGGGNRAEAYRQLPAAAAPVKGTPHTQGHKAACEQPKDQGEEGVCASVRQAKAAEEANDISRSGLWWNRLGIVIIGATFLAACFAAWYAKRAAEHTEAGAAQARRSADAAEHQSALALATQRAWITITADVRAIRGGENSSWAVFTIDLLFKNIGQTVARDVRHHAEFGENGPENYEGLRTMFETNHRLMVPTGVTIIPGESRQFRIDSWYDIASLQRAHPDNVFSPTVYAFCDYSIETDDERKRSDSLFRLVKSERGDIMDIGIPVDPLPDSEGMRFEGGSITAT